MEGWYIKRSLTDGHRGAAAGFAHVRPAPIVPRRLPLRPRSFSCGGQGNGFPDYAQSSACAPGSMETRAQALRKPVIPAKAGIQVSGERHVPVDAGVTDTPVGVTDTPVGVAPAAARRFAVPAGRREAGGSVSAGAGVGEPSAPRPAFASTGPWGRVRSCRRPRLLRGGRGSWMRRRQAWARLRRARVTSSSAADGPATPGAARPCDWRSPPPSPALPARSGRSVAR